jgi:hypothetical protein
VQVLLLATAEGPIAGIEGGHNGPGCGGILPEIPGQFPRLSHTVKGIQVIIALNSIFKFQ